MKQKTLDKLNAALDRQETHDPLWGAMGKNWVMFPGKVETLDDDWIAARALWNHWKAGKKLTDLPGEITLAPDHAPDKRFTYSIVYNPAGDGRFRVSCNGRCIDMGESKPI